MTTQLNERQFEAAKILSEALHGDRLAQNKLVEGISTSDYPTLLNPALNQIVLNNYAEQPKIWNQWASKETVDDFRPQEFLQMQWDGTDPDVEPRTNGKDHFPGGLALIPEYGEYPVIRFSASGQNISVEKNGVQIKLSWESIVNDRRFDLLRRIPAEFGKRAAVTEDVEATRPLLDTDNFSAANQNVLSGNPALSMESLKAAFDAIAQQRYNGNKVTATGPYKLVVPEELEMTAREILAVQTIETVTTDGTTEQRTVSGNPVSGKFEIVVNPYLTALGGSATSWYLIPTPGSTPNPSIVDVFLAGRETPQIFVQKTTTGDPVDGAFIDDSYSTKVRHVVKGGFIRPEGTMFSAGTANP